MPLLLMGGCFVAFSVILLIDSLPPAFLRIERMLHGLIARHVWDDAAW